MSRFTSSLVWVFLAAGVVSLVALLPFLMSTGTRPTTPIETVSSVPYQVINNQTIITEPLAHFDLQLHEPVINKKANITLTFLPGNADSLAIGIRENSFWLSYTPVTFFTSSQALVSSEPITKTITIPLADKLPDQDGSLDVIIFANQATEPDSTTQVTWKLLNLSASVEQAVPTWMQTKDFIKSLIKRERII